MILDVYVPHLPCALPLLTDPESKLTARCIKYPWTASEALFLKQHLKTGGLMAYPTETSYALGGNALHSHLVESVYTHKSRSPNKPLPLLVADESHALSLTTPILPVAQRLITCFWPGPLTMVFHAGPNCPKHLRHPSIFNATALSDTIALRWSPHPVLTALMQLERCLLIATSANLSNHAPCQTAEEVIAQFGHLSELIVIYTSTISASTETSSLASTLLDATTEPFHILREGVIPRATLEKQAAIAPRIEAH